MATTPDDEQQTYAIGIDLGTTNSAISWASLAEELTKPTALAVPQLVAPSEVGPCALLPSFLYLPAKGQFADGALSLPWDREAPDVVGVFARDQGASTPGRLVSSAKSWLSHARVDRRAPILPWGAEGDVPKVSPLQASARYLQYLRKAWEEAHPEAPFDRQEVVLTVPASFDAVARELTVEAALLAGIGEPRLLEEPQAALYDWLAQRGTAWRDELAVGDVIVVIDIGGGTTDFSLITVRGQDGVLELERIAVGDHILLGGDNMDLALAHHVRVRLEQEGTQLDDWQMRALTHACRSAKETLLGADPPEVAPIVIPSRGRRLIGGTIRTEIVRSEVDAILLDGFFPDTAVRDSTKVARRGALTTVGLPYASDAAITRHLAAFLARAQTESASPSSFVHPTAILFNGGVTQSPLVRDRIRSILTRWIESEGGAAPRILSGTDAELAVSRGAAYYGHVRRRGGVRIRGGAAQSYYIGIERMELAVPGVPPRFDAVCVAPCGMEEGSEVVLQQEFGLILGEPVSFRFFGSPDRRRDAVGDVISLDAVTELAPIETTLDGDVGHVVHVQLHAKLTEVGTLELAAVDAEHDRRWKLSFDVRVQ